MNNETFTGCVGFLIAAILGVLIGAFIVSWVADSINDLTKEISYEHPKTIYF